MARVVLSWDLTSAMSAIRDFYETKNW